MTTLLANIAALLSIIFILYWFWFHKMKISPIKSTGLVEIKVKDGIYQPNLIHAIAGKPLILRFIRMDASPCAEMLIISQLHITQSLPFNVPTDIAITISQSGQYEFTCQMGMYRGYILVESQ